LFISCLRSEYPEYFEQIEHPMDLATVKSKINNYSSVGEALADLRAIWDNCRVFNAEGSDILNSAENCSAMLESFVQVSLFSFECVCAN